MNIRRRIFTIAAAALFTTSVYAADEIKVGVTGPYTGGSSSMGVSMRDGVRLATKEINAAGGVGGKKLVLIERDDEAKNERGVQIAQELINNEKVVATLGFINTGVALASQRFYGQLGREDLEKALKARGITPVAVEKFNIGDVDMTSQLLKAKAAGAEVVLTYAIGPELAQIANGMGKLGWKKPMIGSWTLSMASFIDTSGKNGNGATMPETFIQQPTTPKRKAFIDAYLKEFKPKNGIIASPVSAAQGYDSVYLLAAAIKQANSTDGQKILAALENLNTKVDGVVMVYDKPFTKVDHEAVTPNIPVMGIVDNGRVEFEYKEDAEKGAVAQTKKK